jgi:SynChlorMet cassette protein ScmD
MQTKVIPTSTPIRHPQIVLREEFDEWGLLFDPEQGLAYGINPVGIFIWKHLDGKNTPQDLFRLVKKEFDQVPDESLDDIIEFIQTVVDKGYAGFEGK